MVSFWSLGRQVVGSQPFWSSCQENCKEATLMWVPDILRYNSDISFEQCLILISPSQSGLSSKAHRGSNLRLNSAICIHQWILPGSMVQAAFKDWLCLGWRDHFLVVSWEAHCWAKRQICSCNFLVLLLYRWKDKFCTMDTRSTSLWCNELQHI